MTENAPTAEEPSIEEILASIRKIISDEPGAESADAAPAPAEPEPDPEPISEPVVAAPAPPHAIEPIPEPEEDILDLSPFESAPPLELNAIAADTAPTVDMNLDLEDIPKMDSIDSSLLPPHLQAAAMTAAAPASPDAGIASPTTLDAAAASLAKLQRAAEPSYTATTQLWVGPRTIEQVVEDQIRPVLKAWLDENLPRLVERLVEKELARMSKRAGE